MSHSSSVEEAGGEEATEEEVVSTPLALLNEDILEYLVTYLPFEDLKNCRLINHLWNRVSTREISPKCERISFQSRAPGVTRLDVETMPVLSNIIGTGWNFPCTEFWVEEGIFRSSPEGETTLRNFYTAVRPLVTCLGLVGVEDFEEAPPTPQVNHHLTNNQQYPSLKTFRVLLVGEFEGPVDILESITRILQSAPNLESLVFQVNNASYAMTSLLNRLPQAPAICSGKVRRLTLEGALLNEHLLKLQEMRLPLKTLHIRLNGDTDIATEHLQGFLESVQENLQKLEVHSYDFKFRGPFIVSLPRLSKVEVLDISITRFHSNHDSIACASALLAFPGISYTQQLSALKRLSFSKDGGEVLDDFLKGPPVESVLELELPHKLDDPTVILQAMRKFPRLKKLKVPAEKNVVKAVYELGEGVEELTIQIVDHTSPSIDELLTGYSGGECRQMMMRLSGEQLDGISVEIPPFLQRLKVLRLTPVYSGARIKITDLSCRLVLLRLNALKCLDFKNGGRPSQISAGVLQRMRNKFAVWYKSVAVEELDDEPEAQ